MIHLIEVILHLYLYNRSVLQQTVAKSRHSRRQLELASIELEELISQLEKDNRQRRSKYLVNLSSNQ